MSTSELLATADQVREGRRIDRAQARLLFEQADDALLMELSGLARARRFARDHATWLIMGIINTTNVCVARCDYCAFYRFPGQPGAYLLSDEQLFSRIDGIRALGGRLVGFNGGFHPDLRVEDYTRLYRAIHERYGDRLAFYEMTVAEMMFLAKRTGVSYAETVARFREAGTQWITGGGAEILDDRFRLRHSPGKYKVEDYFAAQTAVLDGGLGSTATMVIGFDESLDERFSHLDRLRRYQDEEGQGRLTSFLCWTYKPYHTELGGAEVSTHEYLRWLGISRIFLDNFGHLRTSVLTRNAEAMLGLRWGADDFDLPTEDEVTTQAGATISHNFEAILDSARALGFRPVERGPWPIGAAR